MSAENVSNKSYLFYLKPVAKTLATVLVSVIIHILATKIYHYHCVGEGWFSVVHTLLYMSNPQCRILLDTMKYTSDMYVLFWTTLISGFLLNFKIVKKGLSTINHNIKYFKNV